MIKIEKELRKMNQNGNLVLDSRDIAEMTGKQHKDLLSTIRGFIKGLDGGIFRSHDFFVEDTYVNAQNRQQPCYLLTKKGCSMVANKMIGEKGILFTVEYVTKFEKMETQLRDPIIAKPMTYAQTLRELANRVEEKERLENQNALLIRQRDTDAPKVDFFDELVDGSHLVTFRDTAKTLNIKENIFMKWLEDKKYIYREGKHIRAYARYVPKLLDCKNFINKNEGYSDVIVKVTATGQAVFSDKLKKEGLI